MNRKADSSCKSGPNLNCNSGAGFEETGERDNNKRIKGGGQSKSKREQMHAARGLFCSNF